MIKHCLLLSLSALFLGCATYKAKYAGHTGLDSPLPERELAHRFYLIGDAGLSPQGVMGPTLKSFKTALDAAPANSTALFLGDNIYPAGFVDSLKDPQGHRRSQQYLDAQLATLDSFAGSPLFIPGNHDWYAGGPVGLERQQRYIESALGSKEVFQPRKGCPIEKIEIGDRVVVLAIDSEWYLADWDRYPTVNDDCEIKDREHFFDELESEIKKNLDKTLIVALHHPLFTYGQHGGQFSLRDQLYPTGGNFPLPLFGTLGNFLRRTSGASVTDLSNKRYHALKKRILTLSQFSDKLIFVSGHEHGLQYIEEYGKPQIVSGSGSKTGPTRLLNGARFSTGGNGYAVLDIYKDGSSAVTFYATGEGAGKRLYATEVLPADRSTGHSGPPRDFPPFVEASVYTEEEVDKSGLHKWLWGERYRQYYATKVKAPTVRLDTLFGGLKVVRKGGGNQSHTLRLEDSIGRQYNMRALRKSAERYLQAIAFKDQFIIGQFEDTYTEDLLMDLYTGAHPYAAFTMAKLSGAVGLYHTNPKLYYIPKQPVLGDFNREFGDGLYMLEEHVSEEHEDLESFGKSKKIENTYELLNELREDEENRVDDTLYVRARLFDILVGDWDRHDDQWRWARFETEDGDRIFRPIPRDRDQVFSRWGDGLIMNFGSRAVPALKIFEGFHEEIRNLKGLTSSPRTYALDMALLSETTREEFIAQAKYLQEHIDGELIDEAFLAFPEEVRDHTLEEIKATLLARKESLVETAGEFFENLNRYAVVTGTDKDDHYRVVSLPDGGLEISAHRIKKGALAEEIYHKRFDPRYTKEIWLYGLDDDDIFTVDVPDSKIRLRIIGGQNNDVYNISKASRKVELYDFKSKENTFDAALGGKIHRLDDYQTNTYGFLNVKASNNQLLPTLGYNPDDGFRIGLADTYTYNGFRRNPFTRQHRLKGAYYFATDGFDLSYEGEFAHVMEQLNLELDLRFTSPNFTQNFFGYGNETVNGEDGHPLGKDYNRVRIRILRFAPALVWRGFLGSKLSLGASYENIAVETTTDRFIEDFYAAGGDPEQNFFGLEAEYRYANTDNAAFPTLGMAFSLRGGYKTNLDQGGGAFAYVVPGLSVDHRISSDGRLVLATHLKGHVNLGDDFEFYQAASIGGNADLRGYRFQRFSGKSAFTQSTDLRYSFRRRTTGLLPVTPGIYGGIDYGRVWFPGEDSGQWHNSYGGGLFLNGVDLLTLNLGLFHASDGARFTFGLGFGF